MSSFPSSLYARWRALSPDVATLEERSDAARVTERLLQLVWHYQRVLRDRLLTLDGRSVRVFHPGFWNHEAGPDFRGALVQIGSGAASTGDIEVDLVSQGWHSHNHDQNPAYRNVILHVIWENDNGSSTVLPTLALKPYLDAPMHALRVWLGRNSLRKFSGPLLGQCGAPLREMSPSSTTELLRQAAQIRLESKAEQIEARARQVGWEQSLWEGLFGALGYKHNVWPMRRVAELLPLLRSEKEARDTAFVLQARLLGVSGLLPSQLDGDRPSFDRYLRSIWDVWWRSREQYSESVLPDLFWRFDGLRPANHPQRRLALAAHWVAKIDFLSRLERWFGDAVRDDALAPSLLEALQAPEDEFWSWHWTFRSRRMARPQPLLGAQRAADLAVNVILPWFWARASAGKNSTAQEIARQRYFAWPRAEDNAVLRLARQRLFGGRNKGLLATAAAQQGLLQVVHDFCDHANAVCDGCQFPGLVRSLEV